MSAGPLGLVGGLFNIPFLFFSLPGGVIADRHDRRRMVILFNFCLLATTSAASLLQAAGSLHFTLILTLCFAYGAMWALNIPSMLGLVKEMVKDPKEFSRVMGAAAGIFAVTLPWQRPLIRDICRDKGLSESEYPL